MSHVSSDALSGLLDAGSTPAVSLYQPTHRANPDSLQDPIRYKNLVVRAESSLKEKYAGREVDALLKPLRDLLDDYQFWTHQEDGLALFRSPDHFAYYKLQRPVDELVVVADTFHVKPLLRIVQSADRFEVLCLERHRFRILDGNRDVLDEVNLQGAPATIEAALGDLSTEPHKTVTSSAQSAVHAGHGGRKDEIDKDVERFFRFVDREVETRFSKPSRQPLLLVALPENQAAFRSLSRNPMLLPVGVDVDPGALTAGQLRERAWAAVEPLYLARLAALTDEFEAARAAGKAGTEVGEAAREVAAGRIGTLLVESGRIIPGVLDPKHGKVEKKPSIDDPGVDDVLDDLAEAVLRTKGEVIVVPADRMPTRTGLAGMLRY